MLYFYLNISFKYWSYAFQLGLVPLILSCNKPYRQNWKQFLKWFELLGSLMFYSTIPTLCNPIIPNRNRSEKFHSTDSGSIKHSEYSLKVSKVYKLEVQHLAERISTGWKHSPTALYNNVSKIRLNQFFARAKQLFILRLFWQPGVAWVVKHSMWDKMKKILFCLNSD